MRPFALSFLLLSFFFYNARAIRLEQGFMQHGDQSIQEENSRLIKQSNGVIGEVIVCKEGNCKGINRKLTTVISSTSTISTTSSKNEENGGNKSKANGGGHEKKLTINSSEHQKVTDDVDIMDYSPAKRKPPIHN
ncbi:hypothetical protein M5689_011522 [Euphorbia peplus]|nr:hypothetical protein M5689_011522 [Euphorbia peplus]